MSLETGTLSPLKRVDQPTSYLTIAKMYRVDDEYSEEDPSEAIFEGEYSTRAGPEGERTSIYAFTPEQLARADVEYSSDPQDEMDEACIPQDPSASGDRKQSDL
ncbi:hypothetical protein E2N92_09725 [Methanofollis formosanus]|uniref:Uncharacterized protein n=2 Tax=Methanofollis formosanus TaxID=299308 RepID=A0A8G1A284_9EURY|nr:hypothetical protein E2N92_09725 [Methanofollis formosanus]